MSTVTLEEAAGVALGAVIGEAENLRNLRLVLFGEEDLRVYEKALSEPALWLAASPGGGVLEAIYLMRRHPCRFVKS